MLYNQVAEEAILGAAMLSPGAYHSCMDLCADDFYLPQHKHIWETLTSAYSAGSDVSPVQVSDSCGVSLQILMAMANDAPVSDMLPGYVASVKNFSRLRSVADILVETEKELSKHVSFDDICGFLTSRLSEVSGGVSSDAAAHKIGTLVAGVIENVGRKGDHGGDIVRTGLTHLDRMIVGLGPGQMITVAAPPGCGKSSFAQTIAINAARLNVPVLLFSLEMDRNEILERFLSCASGLDTVDIASGRVVHDRTMMEQLRAASNDISALGIWIDDREALKINEFEAACRRWRARFAPDGLAVIALDYLQLLTPDKEYGNRNLEVSAMTRAIKRTAKAIKCPIVSLSQLSRSYNQGGMPQLSWLRDSGAIEQDSDKVLFLWRGPEEDGAVYTGNGKSSIVVGKNRAGPTGVVDVFWVANNCYFRDI